MVDLYHRLLKKTAHFQVEHPYITLLILFLFTVSIYGGVSKVRTVASLEQMMPKDIDEIKAFNVLRDNYMGQDMIAVILEIDRESSLENGIVDIRDYKVYNYVKELKSVLSSEPDVITAYAYSDIIDMFSKNNINQDSYAGLLTNSKVKEQLSNFINNDYTISVLIITTDISADDTRMNLLSSKLKEHINSMGHPPGIKITLTGTPVIQQKLGELISFDRSYTQKISTLFVFLVTMLTFGTFTSALVPIIVVTLSVNWLYGTMGYTNLPISTLAGGVAAMVIGIGIDFAIHIMNKFKLERKKGIPLKKAVELTVVETGTALTATSMTTMAAFLAFLVGRMPEMGRFGMLMAIGIAYSLFFSLFGLPAMLVIEEKIIKKLSKKMRFGVESEYRLEEKR